MKEPLIDAKTQGKRILQMITNHAMDVFREYTVEERIYNLEMFKVMVDTQLDILKEERDEKL